MKTIFLLLLGCIVLVNSPALATNTLTIATYNIHGGIPDGFSTSNYWVAPCDVQNLADVITSSGATIVGLQEVKCEWQPQRAASKNVFSVDLARWIASGCAMNFAFGSTINDSAGYPANTDYLEWGNDERWQNNAAMHGEFGNALLSRCEITGLPTNIPLPTDPGEEQRACLRVQYRVENTSKPVIVFATHLHHRSGAAREKQFNAILSHAKSETSTSIVFLLGDLNSHPAPGEPDLMEMAAASGFHDVAKLHSDQRGTTPVNTFPAGKSTKRIDYIFCSRALAVLSAGTLETTASDHLPLVATVVLPK